MSSQKIKIEGELLEKAKQCAEASGYASVDEFVLHTIEKEVKRLAPDQGGGRESKQKVTKRLQGLGYIEYCTGTLVGSAQRSYLAISSMIASSTASNIPLLLVLAISI